MLGTFRTLIKRIIMFIPGFGTAMYLLNWPFLTRKADKDLAYLAKLMAQYKKDGLPLWLTCFPEGTRYTEKKHADSLAFAKERGLIQMQVRARGSAVKFGRRQTERLCSLPSYDRTWV